MMTAPPAVPLNAIKPFMTIDDVAEILRLSTKQVRRIIASGDLVAHRFGRLLRVSPEDLQDYVARHRRPRISKFKDK